MNGTSETTKSKQLLHPSRITRQIKNKHTFKVDIFILDKEYIIGACKNFMNN